MKLNFLFLLALFVNILFANENTFILKHDGLLDKRVQNKIKDIGIESKQKLGVNIISYIIENNGINPALPREQRKKMMIDFNNKILTFNLY